MKRGDSISSKFEELNQRSIDDKKDAYKFFMEQSPLARTKAEIKKHLEAAVAYRISVLTNVSTFEGLPVDVLSFLAQNMEEVYFVKGDNIITQDDLGDSFFVLEMGVVAVTRQSNIYEHSKELKKLYATSYFGELALINEEPRSASITVYSDTAKCLKMTKSKFDEITFLTKMFNVNRRSELSEEMTDKITLLKSLSIANRTKLLESMSKMTFSPGAYICRQGTVGNIFYIITEGSCKVTLDTEDWKEKEVNRMHPGDCFGEVALLDPHYRRSANVIAFDKVKCLTLGKADFGLLLNGARSSMVQVRKMRVISDQQALGKPKQGPAGDALKDSNPDRKLESENAYNTRVSSMNSKGVKIAEKIPTLLKRLGRFMSDSLYFSLYARMYRDLLLNPQKSVEYGEKAAKIMREDSEYSVAVDAIRQQVRVILEKEPAFRSSVENLFITGFMCQKNGLKDRLTKGWQSIQFNDLCRTFKMTHAKPMRRILDLGSKGTTSYMILRGCVRIFSRVDIEALPRGSDVPKATLQYERDLGPGEYFGEAVLSGVRTRAITAVAMTACDLVSFEDDDFLAAQEVSVNMTVEERVKFLSQVFFFRDWEPHRLNCIANALTQLDFNKGCNIVKNNEISKNIYFVLRGRVDVLPFSESKSALLSIQKFDYFGESGFMNANAHMKSSKLVTELFTMQALTRVDLLVLSELEFHLIDGITADVISNYFAVRTNWREIRSVAVLQEMKVFRDFMEKRATIKPINENMRRDYEKEKRGEFEVLNQNIEKTVSVIQKKNIFPPSSVPSTISSFDELHSLLIRTQGHSNSSLTNLSSSCSSYSCSDQNSHIFSPQITRQNSTDSMHPTILPKNLILQSLNYQLSSALEEISNHKKDRKKFPLAKQSSWNISKNSSVEYPGTNSLISIGRENNGNNGKYGNDEKILYGMVPVIPRLLDLEDIPSLLDDGFDPLMVIGAANNNRDRTRINNNLLYLKSPQLGRTSDYTSKKNQMENIKKYRDLEKLKGRSSDEYFPRKLLGSSNFSEYVRSSSLGMVNTVFDDNDGVINKIFSEKARNNGMIKINENNEISQLTDDYLSLTGYEKSMLFGSGKIPSVKSYCQTLTPLDNFPTKTSEKN